MRCSICRQIRFSSALHIEIWRCRHTSIPHGRSKRPWREVKDLVDDLALEVVFGFIEGVAEFILASEPKPEQAKQGMGDIPQSSANQPVFELPIVKRD